MNFKNIPKWILTQLSVATMVFMPVAQGRAAEKQQQEISKAMVQNAVIEMGLNKSMTYGEFFQKNKDKYPLRLQKELAPYFAQFANSPMPQFDVGSVKGSDGQTYPTLRISQNGQLYNVQFFGEKERYAKFNNTTLTEVDLINFDDAVNRVIAGDAKLRQQLEPNATSKKSESKSFNGFPEINKESWVKLTPEQRAGYVISMRLLYNDAHGVLLALAKNKKTKKGKKFSYLESFLGQEAIAQDKGSIADPITTHFPDSDPEILKKTEVEIKPSASNNYGLDSCLVAGYVTKYEGGVCKYKEMVKNYTDVNSLARKAYESCGENKIACNPLVFGAPGGKPICLDRKNNADVQIATHYSGPCERNNHTNSEIEFLNNKKLNKKGRYDNSNVKLTAQQIEAIAKKEQSDAMYKATKDYLAGVLQFKNKDLYDLFMSNKPNDDVIKELLQIKNNFDSEIKQGTEACKAASENKKDPEKNFWGACDQLQRRFIFVAEYLSQNPGCLDKKPVNDKTLKCSCGEGQDEVAPGSECKVKPVPPVVVSCPEGTTPSEKAGNCLCKDSAGKEIEFLATLPLPFKCVKATPVDHSEKCYDPACTSDQVCELQAKSGDVESWQCVPRKGKPVPPDVKKKKVSFFQKALPWVVGLGALAGMYFLFKPKQPKLNPAGDLCPNGSNAPCTQTCTTPVNSVFVAGAGCVCQACPPTQTIMDASNCTCGFVSDPGKKYCADGVTLVDDLASCPASLYTCWDGSQVTSAINCPEKPATKTNTKTNTKTTR